jgi:hypothetical protein
VIKAGPVPRCSTASVGAPRLPRIAKTPQSYSRHLLQLQSSHIHQCYKPRYTWAGKLCDRIMRATLRRSCDACAKAKLSCDLRTPQCSRCIKRKSTCAYANEPLTNFPNAYASYSANSGNSTPAVEGTSLITRNGRVTPTFEEGPAGLLNPAIGSLDPFDSYPPARLPRVTIQHLIHHCNSSSLKNLSLNM